tara:strand:- start:18366 stop:19364 length:999 start_codon:yes stop_codon:yes gene_type:complete
MDKRTKRIASTIFLGIVLVSILIQFIGAPIEKRPILAEAQFPKEINTILKRACYNCHSNVTDLKWYDKLAPISWFVKKDVELARSVMNFSEWDSTPAAHKGKSWAILNMVKSERMPLGKYLVLHPEARISSSEIKAIENYVHSLSKDAFIGDTARKESANKEFEIWKQRKFKTVGKHLEKPDHSDGTVRSSPNEIAYSDDFKKWKILSLNTLYDGTMRVTYGNDIAVRAIGEEQIDPFPNGAIVAKAVWEQVENRYGEIIPDKFVNVQFMVKNNSKYRDTEGWGFAKFSTQKRTPYGKTSDFAVTSCISCHRLKAKETGYLFNVPLKTAVQK